jgi:hypothetical protein
MNRILLVEIGIGVSSIISTAISFLCVYRAGFTRSSERWSICETYFQSFLAIFLLFVVGQLILDGDWNTVAVFTIFQETIEVKLIGLIWAFNSAICINMTVFCLSAPSER